MLSPGAEFRFSLVTRGPPAQAIKGPGSKGPPSRRPDLLIFIRGLDCSTLPLKLTVAKVTSRFISDYTMLLSSLMLKLNLQ